jgi:hypothetical protein
VFPFLPASIEPRDPVLAWNASDGSTLNGALILILASAQKAIASLQLSRPHRSPKLLGSGCVECQRNPCTKREELR